MVIKNHIAYRFLTDPTLRFEMCGTTHPGDWKKLEDIGRDGNYDMEQVKEVMKENMSPELESFLLLSHPSRNKTYYVTETVIKQFELLKVSKSGPHYNWKVFSHLKDQKVTLILPGNKLLRVFVHPNTKGEKAIELFWLTYTKKEDSKIDGTMFWVLNYFYPETGFLCEHFDHPDTLEIEEFLYKLLCFFYLSENTEEIVAPKAVHGTRKTGKTLNDLPFPLTVVTSKWNITSIRTEGFMVSGHFRLQPKGVGRSEYEMIFIEPFSKNGYKRTAGKKFIN